MHRSLVFLPMLVLCLFMFIPPLRKITDNLLISNYYRLGYEYSAEQVSWNYWFYIAFALIPILYVYRNELRKPFKSWIEYEEW